VHVSTCATYNLSSWTPVVWKLWCWENVFLHLFTNMSDQFLKQQINIKFCVILGKLLLKMKHSAFIMIPKANDKICNGNSQWWALSPFIILMCELSWVMGMSAVSFEILLSVFGIILKAPCFISNDNFLDFTQNLMLICCLENQSLIFVCVQRSTLFQENKFGYHHIFINLV